jgi:hypothetical protein
MPSPSFYLSAFGIAFLIRLLWAPKTSLSGIPQPRYGSLTALPLVLAFSNGTIISLVENTHKKIGKIIRLGPRQVWVSEKAAIHQILLEEDLPKIGMYGEISRYRKEPGLVGERYGLHSRTSRAF